MKSLPDQDPPEIFGMHSNADIAFQRDTSDLYCREILNIAAEKSGGGGDDDGGSGGDNIILEIVNKYIEGIPQLLSRSEISDKNFEPTHHQLEYFHKLLVPRNGKIQQSDD